MLGLHGCQQVWGVFGEHADEFLSFFVHAFCSGQSLRWFATQQADIAEQTQSLHQEDLGLRVTFLVRHHVVAKLCGHDLSEFHSSAFDVAFNLDEGL